MSAIIIIRAEAVTRSSSESYHSCSWVWRAKEERFEKCEGGELEKNVYTRHLAHLDKFAVVVRVSVVEERVVLETRGAAVVVRLWSGLVDVPGPVQYNVLVDTRLASLTIE